ncbi:MAG: triose-phosphate isomerase [Gemmatimonadetes bacterium]|uniref:Triosephosphate isomerase n=1 Tax=Candidatus Kutchimonas denitrificans TaxID=3056748 RepID=A0AAE5CD68_9BACT|nr:triose-phosphate isomerase [Gemmatimonadota bacterium]NIR75194.1 triose-phosphate isomerase [Candidatus Kutchimonas denitrificans]NIS00132.1 triose-phosphate isomerase [Gemmatimonadota bacterium]NIT65724.1 triose-phosphate isomerase [Gemmatimonadota bacterium]NIU53002.1 triose-phosphate isomerase [Gemmatimonadota bacterium]
MSLEKPFFGGNWKMNHGPTAARRFVGEFVERYPARDDRTVAFFPPSISVTEFRDAAAERPDLELGVQDVYWEEAGAFTGSISAPLAKDAGARYALAGHSERRHVFGDSDEDVARKVESIAAAELIPVLCVGERLEERDRGDVEAVVSRQLEAGLGRLSSEQIVNMVIAYEPVWAIGTGRTASAEDANEVHALIRGLLGERLDRVSVRGIPIIYGGSVKPANVDELLAEAEIDGVLVGGASLDPVDFARICQAA